MSFMKKLSALLLVFCMVLPGGAFAVDADAEPTEKIVTQAEIGETEVPETEVAASGNQMVNGTYIIEAEKMSWSGTSMKKVADDTCSGGYSMQVKSKTESTNLPRVSSGYDLTAEADMSASFVSDTYEPIYIWVYARADGDGSDSLFWTLDAADQAPTSYATSSLPGEYKQYHWKYLGYYDRANIDETLMFRFQYRELGVYLDKFVFTTDMDYQPVNIGDKPGDTKPDYSGLYPAPKINPIAGHPRVLFTAADIPTIKANAASEAMSDIFANTKAKAGYAAETNMKLDTTKRNYNQVYLERITNCALLYALGMGESYGTTAVEKVKDYLATVRFDMKLNDETRSVGQTMMTAGVVYDWCYDLLTEDDKAFFIRRMKTLAKKTEIGYPPSGRAVLTGHGGEGEIFGYQLLCGIAVFDEDPEMYNLAAGRMFDEMLEARVEWNKSGAHPVGGAYGATRFDWELMANLLYLGMGYDSIMGDISDLKNVAQTFMYYRQPAGGQLKNGDDYSWAANKPRTWWTTYNTMFEFAAAQTGDPYLQQSNLVQQFITGAWGSTNYKTVVPDLVLYNAGTETKFWDSLPLVKKTNYPLTSIQARTNWKMGQDSNAVLVDFAAREIADGPDHNHADTGSFQIYYKGNLTMDTGVYQGKDGDWGSTHYFNYYCRTIANNCMTVFDPNETFTSASSNDGGQRIPLSKSSYEDHKASQDRAVTNASYVGPNTDTPEFSFVKTNLTGAYAGSKVSNHERSMLFMDLDNDEYPAAVVIFDDVTSSNKTFQKTWNMHSETQPEISGNTTIITRTDNGNDGKLVNKTMLPENPQISTVGGAGHEYEVNGVNYPNDPSDKKDYAAEPEGKWRIEISPDTDNNRDYFLNSMYVTDASANLPELPMYKEETDSLLGVTVMDRSVYFAKDDQIKTAQTLTLRDNGYETVKCLVTDIAPGVWSVTDANGTTKRYQVKSDENTLYFRAVPGACTIEKTSGAADNIAYAKMTKPTYGDFMVYNMTTSGRNNLTNKAEERRQFYAFDQPTVLQNGKKLVPAKEVFEQSGGSFRRNGNAITVQLDGTTYSLTLDTLNCVAGDKNYLLSTAPTERNGVVYINAADFFETYYDSRARILRLSDASSVASQGSYTIKQGDTTITQISSVDATKPLEISGFVQTEAAQAAVDVLCVVSKGDRVERVWLEKSTANKTKQEFQISATGLPEDFATGGYDLTLYFWADAGTLEPVTGAISVFG